MTLHLSSVLVITALVVNVSGILFILETFLRRDEGAGRIWSVGFLAAMLTTLAYAVWAQSDGAWWPVAVGNAAFVAGTGFMWLGCRRFNARRMTWAAVLVAVAVLAAGISVAVEGDRGGDWAGALWMFAALVVFAGAGAVECFRGALRRSRTAWVLGAVLAFQSLYYVARTTVFVVSGPESDVFQAGFGTMSLSFLTVTLTIVAVVVTSVLRASRAPMRGYVAPAGAERSTRGIEPHAAFARSLAELCERAAIRSEPVAVTSVRIDDLEQISSAFGSEVAGAVGDTWRASVRKHAPANAMVAEDGASGLLVALAVPSAQEARRQAGAIYRGVFDDLGRVGGGVIPVVGIGIALTESVGGEPADLMRVAREAASRAATSIESSVLIGDADEEPSRITP
jgi:GGDEF domain-containing protein